MLGKDIEMFVFSDARFSSFVALLLILGRIISGHGKVEGSGATIPINAARRSIEIEA